ncbi:hypothetical protein C0J52_10191 [Blattella germanica]|nr:hypothetical protein C0J52_10191 [Blattella germanica]
MELGSAETVMQRIEELREWQRQQQQKLLQQQEEQRILLSNEQQRIYQEFGLNDPSNEEGKAEFLLSSSRANTSNYKSWLDSSSEKDLDESQQSLTMYDIPRKDCHRRLSPVPAKIDESPFKSVLSRNNFNLDETPVNTSRKNFHELLQEKLTQLGSGDHVDNYQGYPESDEKPKRKFLRKGEGIARFRMQPTQIKQTNKRISHKRNVSTHHAVVNDNANVKQIKKSNNKTAKLSKENNIRHKNSKARYPKTAVSKLTLKKTESSPPTATWAEVLQQQNVHEVAHVKVHKTQNTNNDKNESRKDCVDLSFLEKMQAERKSKKEVEELKIFELLEQHAANSSFCSTSSLVARLMEGSINSTPVKNHPIRNYTYQNDIYIPKSQHGSSDRLASDIGKFSSKNPIVGYLPFGLDTEEFNGQERNSGATTGAYQTVTDAVPKLALNSPCASSDVQSKKTDDGYSSLSERNLRVRFSETNDYKSVSDTSFSSQDNSSKNTSRNSDIDSSKNTSRNSDVDSSKNTSRNSNSSSKNASKNSEARNEMNMEMKRFQDDQAWSDCSCSGSDSPSNSCNVSNISHLCESPEPRPLPEQHHIYNMISQPIYPPNLGRTNLINHSKVKKTKMVDAGVNTQTSNSIDITEKSSLLKSRLEELEREIEIFRKENLKIHKLKKEHEDDVTKFNKDKKEFEKNMKDDKERMESALREEKRKLQKEKQVFDKYCKDLKNQPSKEEREEIQSLREQPVRTKSRKLSSTKVIHTVNEHIAKIKPGDLEDSIIVHDVVPTKKIPSSILQHKAPSQAKSKNPALKKNEWGSVNCSKTYQNIPDLETRQNVEATIIPEEMKSQGMVTNHKMKPNSKNDIISLHAPSETASYTSAEEEDDDLDYEDVTNKKPEDRNSEPQLDPRINGALFQAFYYAAQRESISAAQEYATKPTKVRGNKVDIGEKESTTSQNNIIGIKEIYTAEIQNFRESSVGNLTTSTSINSGMTNVMDAQLSNDENVDQNSGKSLSSLSGSQSSDIVAFSTAKSSQVSNIETHNMPVDKNNEEYIPTHDEIYIHDRKRLPYNGGRNSFENFEKSHESSPNANRIIGRTTGLLQKSNLITKQIGDTSTGTLSKIPNHEKIYPDGRKEIWYPNGNLKKISADGSEVKVIYYNGDVKETLKDGTVKYFYAETKTWHTTYLDGSEILEFPDGQMETRQRDGTKAVTYPNATVRTCFPDGREEWVFQDGLMVKVDTKLGEKVLLLPNGQREVHTREHMRREYPDGTVKILYPDGIQETRYSNGRIRVKDKDGKLVMDSIMQRL